MRTQTRGLLTNQSNLSDEEALNRWNATGRLTIEQCRKIDPRLMKLSDKDILVILHDLYGLGQLAFDQWSEQRQFQKSH
ncbi:MAG: hypothetical protein WC553_00995 [Patescibacteria group bacterium]